MNEKQWLAERFEEHRAHLRAVAYRMLGSLSEADDAVQEAWLRLSRSTPRRVENLGGWLTTVVARVCLNMLRPRAPAREQPLGPAHARSDRRPAPSGTDPEHEALLADAIGLALLVVLETLAPAERLAFVLHDMFDLPFEEIAPMVERSPARPASSPAGPDAGYERGARRQTPTCPASARSSTPSSPPPATATSTPSSRCSTPMSSCVLMAASRVPTAPWWSGAPRRWPHAHSPSPAWPRSSGPR